MSAYFFDGQCRRFLTQFIAIFSNFDVQYGTDPQGNPILHRVPVVWGDASRATQAVISGNSPSALPSAPMMSVYVSGMEYDQRRTQDPYFLDKLNVRQRTLNQQTGQYETTQGNAFTVERIMPVPYTMRVSVDIWTTSQQQKFEIFEQLGVLFNPSMEIQSTDNFIDWTSLSVIYQDGINWSSRSVPQGTSNAIDITTWKFYMPIWISSPIRVRKLGMIQKIIASIHKGSSIEEMSNDSLLMGTRQKITPYGYKLLLMGNKLQVVPASTIETPENESFDVAASGPDTDIYWQSFLNVYGVVRPGVSMISLEHPYLISEIAGTIEFDLDDDRFLTYNIDPDTLPSNTLDSVDRIIDPNTKWPTVDGSRDLPDSIIGQRYLFVDDLAEQQGYNNGTTGNWPGLTNGVSSGSIVEYVTYTGQNLSTTVTDRPNGTSINSQVITVASTGGVVAGFTMLASGATLGVVTAVDHRNSMVTIDTPLASALPFGTTVWFQGTAWAIVFEPLSASTVEYVTNITSGVQYRFVDGGWQKSVDGWYDAGSFMITI